MTKLNPGLGGLAAFAVIFLLALHYFLALNSNLKEDRVKLAAEHNPGKMIGEYLTLASDLAYCQNLYSDLDESCAIEDLLFQSVDEMIALCEQEDFFFGPGSAVYVCADNSQNDCRSFTYCLASNQL